MKQQARKELSEKWMYGLNITAYLNWFIANIAGAFFGEWISNPEKFGLDFALAGDVYWPSCPANGQPKKFDERYSCCTKCCCHCCRGKFSGIWKCRYYCGDNHCLNHRNGGGKMEVRWSIFLIILGSALVTFIPRVLPIAILSRVELPEWAMRWLSYVPIAVMAALVGQELLMPNGKLEPLHKNLELIAALPAFIIAIVTRSLLGTVVAGIISLMVLRFVL